jgi:class 3 adenylate cyclase/tetratricopeptide (TPR) repeat protein
VEFEIRLECQAKAVDVAAWLRDVGLERYAQAFLENDIRTDVLPDLTETDLEKLGVSLGDRKRFLKAIAALQIASSSEFSGLDQVAGSAPRAFAAREAERRQLTVLFCDLVGSTELSARLDPEEMREVIGAYQANVAEVVRRWDGYVARYMGDGALAYFGWPRAHEDDAERAVRAGLELVQTIAALTPAASSALQVRVGIATGHVVVGDLGGQGTSDKDSVVGETPNLASRLQSLAEPGSIVISQATRRLVGAVFELDDLGPQRLKGFAEPLAVWRVLGQSKAEGPFEARHTTGLTPLVGRDEELSLLLRRWEQAKDGEGQVVLLSGEPGIGKSRLVWELRWRLEGKPHLRLTYQCSPHHTTSPLHPVIEQLERAAGFRPDDSATKKLHKLEALLARGTDRLDEAVPLTAALLGIPSGERCMLPELTPQRQKQLTLEALTDQLEGLAKGQPVLLVYEDLHWIDPTSQELLGLAIERIQRSPVLAIISFRPEFVLPWPWQPHVSAVPLTRLGRRDGAAMVERVVGEKPLPPEVAVQIVAKTDGVPLFVEELTKTVLEAGLLRETDSRYELTGPLPPLAIPASLHDSLLARLDHLAPVKEVAQIGAVIGREFPHELLAAVSDRPEDQLNAALDQLVASELVFRRGASSDATYSFKHALVQDAAYSTLLKSRRRHLHARIAQVLQDRFPRTADTQPELLAHHSTQAGLTEKAAAYWYKAGRQAMARSAMAEAVAQLTRGLNLLADLPADAARDESELDLQVALGGAFVAIKGYAAAEVGRAFARARELCTNEARIPQLLAVLSGLFVHHMHASNVQVALEIAREMLGLAERRKDIAAQAVGHRCLGAGLMFHGELRAALTHFKQAIPFYRSADRTAPVFLWGSDVRVACLNFAPLVVLWQGYPDQAVARSRDAFAAAHHLRHMFTLSHVLHLNCWLHQVVGKPQMVLERAAEQISLAGEHALPVWLASGQFFHGWAVAIGGEIEAGIAEMRQGLATVRATGVHRLQIAHYLGLLSTSMLKRIIRPRQGTC